MKKLILLAILLLFMGAAVAQTNAPFHNVQIVDERGVVVTSITSVEIYAPNTTTNAVIYSDRGLINVMEIPITESSTNTTLVNGVLSWYGPDGYDFSITDGTNVLTNANHRTRTAVEGTLVFPSYITSISTTTYEDGDTATFGTSSDWVAEAGTVSDRMTWTPATTSTSQFYIGNASFTADLNLWGDSTHMLWDASESTLEILDNTIFAVGTGDDYTISHNGSTTTVAGAATNSGVHTFSTDVIFDGTNNIKFDDNRFQLHFQDDAILGIGGAADAAGDVTLSHDGSDFSILSAIADEGMLIGGTTTGFDITYAFETAGQIRTDYDGDFINLTDDMDMRFGTGAGADGDFQISSSSGNVLTVGQIVAGTGTIAIGVDDAGIDTTFYGDTTLISALWDTDADSWYFTGASTYLIVEGATVDGSEHTVSFTDPTADIIWTFPDGGADTVAVMASTLATNYPDVANSVTGGTNQLIFEGTVDAHEHVITGTDATADVVWTLADGGASTVSFMASTLATNFPEIANSVTGGTNQLIFEGTVDGFETILTANDATADATLAFPDDSGDVVYAPEGVVDYAAGAGALPITHTVITYESTGGAEALTLADGKPGQILQVNHDTDGGNGVITPATALGYTSVDLADDGDMVTFQFVDTQGWIIIGTAGNAAPPVVTP